MSKRTNFTTMPSQPPFLFSNFVLVAFENICRGLCCRQSAPDILFICLCTVITLTSASPPGVSSVDLRSRPATITNITSLAGSSNYDRLPVVDDVISGRSLSTSVCPTSCACNPWPPTSALTIDCSSRPANMTSSLVGKLASQFIVKKTENIKYGGER